MSEEISDTGSDFSDVDSKNNESYEDFDGISSDEEVIEKRICFSDLIHGKLEKQMDYSEIESSEIESDDEEADLSNLNEFVQSIGKDNRKSFRNDHSTTIACGEENEFGTRSEIDHLELLLKPLSKKLQTTGIKKGLEKGATVSAPLEYRTQEKIKRQISYKSVSKDISKWTSIVAANRRADQLVFPLNQSESVCHSITCSSLTNSFKPIVPMEEHVKNILEKAKLSNEHEIIEQEENMLKTHVKAEDEITAQHLELQKMRSLLFYAELKQKRASKIKSKMYRKLKRKEQLEENSQSMEDLDRSRAEERMTLRHKNKRNSGIIMNSNKSIVENKLQRHQMLMKKIHGSDNEDDEDIENPEEKLQGIMNELGREQEIPNKGVFSMKFMKDGLERSRKMAQDSVKEMMELSDDDGDAHNTHKGGKMSFGFAKQDEKREEKKREEALSECDDENNPWMQMGRNDSKVEKEVKRFQSKSDDSRMAKSLRKMRKEKNKDNSELNIEQDLILQKEEAVANLSEPEVEPFFNQKELVKMAFSRDNVVEEEFELEKKKEIESDINRPKDVTLPGWGCWAGSGININESKRKRIFEYPEDPGILESQRKDKNLKMVVISEKKDKKFENLLVKGVPFPFKTKEQYESTFKNPLGREWNTSQMHNKFTLPKVVVKRGSTILPIKFCKQPIAKNSLGVMKSK